MKHETLVTLQPNDFNCEIHLPPAENWTVNETSSFGEVNCPKTISTLGCLIEEFRWDPIHQVLTLTSLHSYNVHIGVMLASRFGVWAHP
jgi:hypothetical protein